MNSNFVKIVFNVQYVNRLLSAIYDLFVNMSLVREMMGLSSVRCDHSDGMNLYTRVAVDVVD